MTTSAARRLLLWSVPVAVLVLFFAGNVAVMTLHDRAGLAAYDRGDLRTAQEEFAANRSVNVLERWKAPYDEGTVRLRAGDPATARPLLDEALRTVPHRDECTVRINLAAAHELLGDRAAAHGDPDGARAAYEQGRRTLGEGGCPTMAGRGPAQTARAQRLDAELRARLDDPADAPTPDPSATHTPTPSPTSSGDDPDEQLQQLNEDAQRERGDSEQQQEDRSGDGPGSYHW